MHRQFICSILDKSTIDESIIKKKKGLNHANIQIKIYIIDWRTLMATYALYHTSSGQYVSGYLYNSLKKRYVIRLTTDMQDIRIWYSREGAEKQLQILFDTPEYATLEIREISMTVPKWDIE